jgi:hypothetical protein
MLAAVKHAPREITMTQTDMSPPTSPRSGRAWTGWLQFAAIMLAVVGSVNVVQGLAALLQDDYFLVRNGDQLLITDFTVWGWILVIWGLAQVGACFGIYTGKGWGRVSAIIIVSVGILIQTVFLSAYPIWSAMIIALDVIVIYALTARWNEGQAGL